MKFNGIKVLNTLSEREKDILCSIYKFRGLTSKQIAALHFTKGEKITSEYCRKILGKLKNSIGVITSERLDKNTILYFLTPKGVSAVKEYLDITEEISFNSKHSIIKSGNSAAALRFKTNNALHQISLNEFVISLSSNCELNFNYYDEKDVSTIFTGIRPDGIIETSNAYYFLENDMGTEAYSDLVKKWEHYRNFVKGNYISLNISKPIYILFILNNKNTIRRQQTLFKSVDDYFIDKVTSYFDILIDTPANLQAFIINNELKGNDNSIETALSSFALKTNDFTHASCFEGIGFDYYSRKINDNNKIIKLNGKALEYILDNNIHNKLSIFKKCKEFNYLNSLFKNSNNRDIKYIVILSSFDNLYKIYQIFDLFDISNLFFTTIERLSSMTFNEAVCSMSITGNLFHYSDMSLQIAILENEKKLQLIS